MQYAGFWMRFLAYVIDGMILSALNLILTIIFGRNIAMTIALVWLYFAKFESSQHEATPGKLILGIKVVDEDGRRISFAKATIRYFAKFISGFLLFIGFILIAVHPRKQGLHDLIAKTYVVTKD